MLSLTILTNDNGNEVLFADVDDSGIAARATDLEMLRRVHEIGSWMAEHGECQRDKQSSAATYAAIAEACAIRPSASDFRPKPLNGRRLRLPKPELALTPSVGEVLSERRSRRSFGPVSPQELSSLLYHSNRVRRAWIADDGYAATGRAAPSAGARHPIDLVLAVDEPTARSVDGESASIAFIHDPFACDLIEVPEELKYRFVDTIPFVGQRLNAQPPAVLVMMANLNTTLGRYPGGLSLVYRDAGALMATIGIVAEALGLACCSVAMGIGVEPSVEYIDEGWIDVGAVAIGGRRD